MSHERQAGGRPTGGRGPSAKIGILGMVSGVLLLVPCGLALAESALTAAPVDPERITSVRTYGYEHGLPQHGVNTLLQTQDGYLWVGTFGGLARFDGQTFRVFHQRGGQDAGGWNASDGPASDRILALYEDARGRLWIGTQDGGISVHDRGRFMHLQVCKSCYIADFVADDDAGVLWATGRHGIIAIDMDSLRTAAIHGAGHTYESMARTADGTLYVSDSTGLYVVSLHGVRKFALPGGDRRVRALRADGAVLWGITDTGLFRFDTATKDWKEIATDLLPDTQLIESRPGELWLSDRVRGLSRLQPSGEQVALGEVPGLHARSMHQDDEGNLWVGTWSEGLWRLRPPRVRVMSSDAVAMNRPGRAVTQDGAGGLWFGMGCHGLRRWHADRSLEILMLEPLLSDCVDSLFLERNGVLWIGTSSGTLGRMAGGTVEPISTESMQGSVGIWRDGQGDHWVASSRRTHRLTTDESSRVIAFEPVEALDGMTINFMTAARKGGNWFVGDQGAYRMEDGRIVERWTPREGLPSRFARALHEDDAGSIWIGTYGSGLAHVSNGTMRLYDQSTGLFDNTVSCIMADGMGRLWMGGNRGISLLVDRLGDGSVLDIRAFDASDGLVPPEINGGATSSCHKDDQGRLWFSLIEGFAVVDPTEFEVESDKPPRVHIESVSVSGKPIDVHALPSLDVGAYNLAIDYTAINFTNPDRTRFRYRISGKRKQWVDAGTSRQVLIPDVPWGEYVFEVQAQNQGGPWSKSASIQLVRPMPWYHHHWIWLVVTLLGLLCLLWSTRDKYHYDHEAIMARIRLPPEDDDSMRRG